MDSDDEISLSEHAMKALQEFYQEKEQKKCNRRSTTLDLIEEDWELSQFWYDKNTALTLAQVSLNVAGKSGRIACISCPTVFTYLQKENNASNDIYLFEYDKRFGDLYQEQFIYYNYSEPLKIPEKFIAYFDIVLVDPPYLSEECLEKTLQTVKHIAKDKIILCTGAVMEDFVKKMLHLRPCDFKPEHERKLGNEFKCYTNWNFDELVKEINVNTHLGS